MGGGQQSSSGGSTDWGSNLYQGGYTQQPSGFNWGTVGRGLQQAGSVYAGSATTPAQSMQYTYDPQQLLLPASEQNYLIPASSNTADMATILQRLLGGY